MPDQESLTGLQLKAPKAAAVAGIVFSVLIGLVLWLMRISVPADALDAGVWLVTSARTVEFAIGLVPFAGIAFLWFIGVLRDRLGAEEGRFFSTIFLGSGLLFLSTLFVGAALFGSIVLIFADAPSDAVNAATFRFARATAYNVMNIYAAKMAGVFMLSASIVVLRTGIVPRWIAFAGFGGALTLLLGSQLIGWSFAVLPAWVLAISVYILSDNFRISARLSRSIPADTDGTG